MATKHDFHKIVIGRLEKISFPEIGLFDIPAKVDTGAYRSSIHAQDINEDTKNKNLTFNLLSGHRLTDKEAKIVTTSEYRVVTVTNSFGHSEERYEVLFKTKLGPKIFHTKFTLSDRTQLNFPVLIGRKLLNHRCIVDTSKTCFNAKELKKQFKLVIPDEEDQWENEA